MNEDAEAAEFVRRLRTRFPDEALLTDAWLAERGWEVQVGSYTWVESFADRTTDAIRAQDWSRVREHTEFISEQLRLGSEGVRRIVDVSYAENLMWNLEQPDKVRAWPHIAEEVRRLYEQMWGIPNA
jgi:hypothetical protein